MLQQVNIGQVLFFDIETVRQTDHFEHLNEDMQKAWHGKAHALNRDKELKDDEVVQQYHERAGIFSEFGKIVCISVGAVVIKDGSPSVRLKSFANDDEKILLEEFSALLNNRYNDTRIHNLCGHNIKEFDVPYVCRRLIINKLPLPNILDISGRKPWETGFLDTMELWKFGDFKAYTSLKTLTAVFGIPSPKGDIDGSQVGKVYWEDADLPRITHYCERDVLATIRVFQCMRGEPFIPDELVTTAGSNVSE